MFSASCRPCENAQIWSKCFANLNIQNLELFKNQILVFAFGEIDVRCHIGKQRDINERDLDEIIETLAINYINRILLNQWQYMPLLCIVYSVIPPTDICFNPDFPFYGTIEDRIMISKKLNARLAALCSQVKIEFLDVYDEYANLDGTLNTQYSDGCVHINPTCYPAIALKLINILLKNKII
ncbi:MAG: hypothetical protein Q8K60_01045 [Parachlamydiaceae bacterium]|nr:hypothetical protein [Parachlamydiaceae bacterium]